MTLGHKLRERLSDLEKAGTAADGTVKVDHAQYGAKVRALELDKLAIVTDEIAVWRNGPKPTSDAVERLMEKQAEYIQERIGYLLERIKSIEFDREGKLLQMRSAEPLRDGRECLYYELLLNGGWEVTLRRCRTADDNSGVRRATMSFTMDVIGRLIDDLAGALSEEAPA